MITPPRLSLFTNLVIFVAAVIPLQHGAAQIDLARLITESDVIFIGSQATFGTLKDLEFESHGVGYVTATSVKRILATRANAVAGVAENSLHQFFLCQPLLMHSDYFRPEKITLCLRPGIDYLCFCRKFAIADSQIVVWNGDHGEAAPMTQSSALQFVEWVTSTPNATEDHWGAALQPAIPVESFVQTLKNSGDYKDDGIPEDEAIAEVAEETFRRLRATYGSPDVTPLLSELDVILPILRFEQEPARREGISNLLTSENPRIRSIATKLLELQEVPRFVVESN